MCLGLLLTRDAGPSRFERPGSLASGRTQRVPPYLMHIESFTCHKDPLRPLDNDDRLVCYAGRLFAVIDGVTDKSGTRLPDGSSRGQAACSLIETVLRDVVDDGSAMTASAATLLARIKLALEEAYRRHGIADAVLRDPHLRFGAQLAAVFFDGAGWRVFVVGDCAVRIDGNRIIGSSNRGDAVLALWRAKVFEAATANLPLGSGTSHDDALAVARAYTVAGTGRFLAEHGGMFPFPDYQRCRTAVHEAALAAFPAVQQAVLDDALTGGLIGLATYRNTHGPLGAACIDGSDVPPEHAHDEVLAAGALATLEIFSDGYFGTPPAGATTVAAWEAHLAHVEATDPFKIGAYPSTKGSSSGRFTDDRSVLIIDTSPCIRTPADEERAAATTIVNGAGR